MLPNIVQLLQFCYNWYNQDIIDKTGYKIIYSGKLGGLLSFSGFNDVMKSQ